MIFLRQMRFNQSINIPILPVISPFTKTGKICKPFLLLCLFTVTLNIANAQEVEFKGFATAGANLSQIGGDEVYGFKKFGFNGGVGVTAGFGKTKTWLMSMEALFTQKGSYQGFGLKRVNMSGTYYDFMYYNVNLCYAEVPVLVHFYEKYGGFTFGAGFSYGRLVYVPVDESGFFNEEGGIVRTGDKDFLKKDFCGVIDVRFKIWKQLKFNFRWSFSIVPVKYDVEYQQEQGTQVATWTKDYYNNTLTARLIWVFNEKEPVKKKSRKQ